MLARLYVAQTSICHGEALERAARGFWRLRLAYPKGLEPYVGAVHFNLPYKASNWVGGVGRPQLMRAAASYRKAAQHMSEEYSVRAWHNYAEICLDLGWHRAARRALERADSPLAEPYLLAGLKARVAAVCGSAQEALAISGESLADPQCGSLPRAYLLYARAVALGRPGLTHQACDCIDQAWHYANKLQLSRLLDRLSDLSRDIRGGTSTEGVSRDHEASSGGVAAGGRLSGRYSPARRG